MEVLLHTHSVMSFILLFTSVGMLVHLVFLKKPFQARNWLIGFYLGVTCWQVENLIRYSVPLHYYGTLPYKLQTTFALIPTLGLTLVSHTQYVYRFLRDTFERERKIA